MTTTKEKIAIMKACTEGATISSRRLRMGAGWVELVVDPYELFPWDWGNHEYRVGVESDPSDTYATTKEAIKVMEAHEAGEAVFSSVRGKEPNWYQTDDPHWDWVYYEYSLNPPIQVSCRTSTKDKVEVMNHWLAGGRVDRAPRTSWFGTPQVELSNIQDRRTLQAHKGTTSNPTWSWSTTNYWIVK